VNLVAPDEHQLLIFWTQMLVLLLVARLLGQAMRRVGQPAVVGQLGAGLLLGPSLLGRAAPDALDWLVPADPLQSGMLFAVSWIGVLLLLIETGFDTDLGLIRRLGRATALVSAGSIVVPLAAGLAVGAALPSAFVGEGTTALVFTLFIAAALSISSLAVAAKVLSELGMLRRNFGQITLAAGMANDVVGWVLLGVLGSLASAGEVAAGPLAVTVGGIALLYAGGLTVGQRGIDLVLREMRQRDAGVADHLTAVITIALVFGVATQLIGAEAVLGAFVAGIAINRSRFDRPEVRQGLEQVTAGFFAPIFFATAGLRVDLGLLADGEVLAWTVAIVVVGATAKFVGSYAGSMLARLHPREGVLLGLGLNPRGTLEIVIATVGLSLGVLNEASYTAIMVMTISLSMAAPPLLRVVARSWHGTDEEQDRLRREQVLATNTMVRPSRMLLPSAGGPNSIVAAQVLHHVWPEGVHATVLAIGPDADRAGVQAVVDVFDERDVDVVEVATDEVSEAILAEARLGYGVIGVGAPTSSGNSSILSPVVDALLSATPLPLVVVRRARDLERPLPGAFARGVIAISPDAASRTAQELGLSLSANIGTEMVLVHSVLEELPHRRDRPAGAALRASLSRLTGVGGDSGDRSAPEGHQGDAASMTQERRDVAGPIMDRATALAQELDARVRTDIRPGPSAVASILAAVEEHEADLLVIGAHLRRLEGRPFLGHNVEQILERCDATVVVVATPEP
jgi:Kef-type K+ transport system membrane component KefB